MQLNTTKVVQSNLDLSRSIIKTAQEYPIREQKILNLENKLYSKVLADETGEHVDNLYTAIELLQANKYQDDQTEIKLTNGFISTFNSVLWSGLQIGIIAIFSSYLGAKFCGNSQSKMCKDFRIIPEFITRYTSEPSKVLPVNLPN